LTHSTLDLSRQHHLHTFSQKLKCAWGNIWRQFVYVKVLHVSEQCFLNFLPKHFVLLISCGVLPNNRKQQEFYDSLSGWTIWIL
jgi:hypothetical protein